MFSTYTIRSLHSLPGARLAAAALGVATLALAMAAPVHAEPAATANTDANAAAPTTLIEAPVPAELQFQVRGKVAGFNYNANAQLHWKHDGQHYEAEQAIRAPIVGTRSQTSTGTIAGAYLQPLTFEDSSRKRRNIRFEPGQHTAIAVESGESQTVPEGAQDRLSVFFQLAATVAGNEAKRTIGQQIPIWTVATNKQEPWVFEVKSIESIDLPAGTLPAIRLERLPRKEGDQLAEIWLSPETGYLPVRIHLEDDGDAVDLRLVKYIAKPLAQSTAAASR